jgi:ornithine cyclodeaminase/alanine dehydrogenase-like protein (mu-crystallin family)
VFSNYVAGGEMKKINPFLTILFLMFLSLVTSCGEQTTGGTSTVVKTTPSAQTIIEEGWVNDNQYRVKAMADTDIQTTDREMLKKVSEADALKKAREAVVKQFVSMRLKQSSPSSASAYAVMAISMEKEFRDIIEGGKIIRREFQNDDRTCTIIYQVEKNGLKKMVLEEGKKKK